MGTNTYEYTGINSSAMIACKAAGKLEGINGKAVKLTEEGIALPEAGGETIGVVLITEDEAYAAGDTVTVQVKDIGLWKAGGEIAMGDLLSADAEGLCQTAATGQWCLARALSPAAQKGDLIKVQILHAGYLSTAAKETGTTQGQE